MEKTGKEKKENSSRVSKEVLKNFKAKGTLPDIPANSHFVFEVECKAVN